MRVTEWKVARRVLADLAAFVFVLNACSLGSLQAQNDSLPPHLELFAGATMGSSAMPPWVLMGVVFGGDITAPLAVTVDRTDAGGRGFVGGQAEAGILMAWKNKMGHSVRMGLTSRAWTDFRWSPGTAHLLWGPLGGADPENQERNLENTQLRGLATSAFTLGIASECVSVLGRIGEAHWGANGAFEDAPFYMDTAQIEFRVEGQFNRSIATGLMAGFDVEIRGVVEGEQNTINWAAGLRDVGGYIFPQWVESVIDTSLNSTGWPLITEALLGEGEDSGPFSPSDGLQVDTLDAGTSDKTMQGSLPTTYYFRVNTQGWTAQLQLNRWAPRPELYAIKTFGHRSVNRPLNWSAGLGWGGWGGLYIPFGLDMNGKEGRNLTVKTRIAPGADLGLRTTLMCSWVKKF